MSDIAVNKLTSQRSPNADTSARMPETNTLTFQVKLPEQPWLTEDDRKEYRETVQRAAKQAIYEQVQLLAEKIRQRKQEVMRRLKMRMALVEELKANGAVEKWMKEVEEQE